MNILQLCNKSPLPPKEGGSIAMYNLAQALISRGHTVDVLTVSTPKFDADADTISKYTSKYYNVEKVFINTNLSFSGGLNAFIRSQPYHLTRFISKDFRNVLKSKLRQKKYNLVLFEMIYMSPYLEDVRKNSDAVCVLRSHNIEHQIWKRVAVNEKNILKKLYLNYLSSLLARYEKKIISKYDAVACISPAEKIYYSEISPGCKAEVVPFGIEMPDFEISSQETTGFYHIGSMDWMPNTEGVRWLFDNVIPILENKAPDIRITLAGRNMPRWIYDFKSPIVEVVGEINDVGDFVKHKRALLVPLLSGSGIRIKIIESMLMAKAIISTSIGAEGIDIIDKENIILADTPEDFANAIIYINNNPDVAEKIGIKGKELIESNHNFNAVIEALENLLNLKL